MDEPVLLHLTESGFRQGEAGVLHQRGVHSTYRLHTHDFYELFLVPKGSAIHVVNGQTQILTGGSLVLIRPSDVHKYEPLDGSDFELLSAGMPAAAFRRLCTYLAVEERVFLAPALPPHRVLSGWVLADAARRLLEAPTGAPDLALYVLGLFPGLVGAFLSNPPKEPPFPPWFSQLIEEMNRPENFVPGLPRLLRLANFSQEHLTRLFRRYLGATPTEFINTKRLELACDLLLAGEVPAAQVGGLCGFNSQSHFYRLFTARYGYPPKKYRDAFLRQSAGSSSSL
ncbi:MAG: AraC family transcriptional regulator [Acutalibacter sp.]|nr:AraC family transcriptional regulator [Acutalibacter sp.]